MQSERASKFPLVSVVIPNYNSLEYVRKLIPTLVKQDYPNYEIIFVDDNSPDKSAVKWVRKNYSSKVRIIENKKNLGFAGANNVGFRASRGKYVASLNNDTIVKSNYISKHVQKLEDDPQIGMLSCKILDGRKKGAIYSSGVKWSCGFAIHLTDDFKEEREVDLMNFCSVFIRRNLFDKIGFIEEKYFMKFEDVDFSLQIKRKTDYKMVVIPDHIVTHLGVNVSMPSFYNSYYRYRNLILLKNNLQSFL